MTHLVVFASMRWAFVYQRPQQLLSRLARHFRVLYVEEPRREDGPARLECSSPAPNVTVLTPLTPVDASGFHDDQIALLAPLLSEYLRANGVTDCIAWFYAPMALPLITQLHPRAVIYDCMDDVAGARDAPRQLRQRESALLKVAGLVLTAGPALFDVKRRLHANVHCLPSAVDVRLFAPSALDPGCAAAREARRLQQDLRSPRLGFYGVIDERIDTGLLAQLAHARPQWDFVMVGPIARIDPRSLPRHPNLHWLGLQPYALLPYLLAGWDVCLVPFALNDSTRFINPTKTLEYMAAEKPVVSTALADVVALHGEVVRVAYDTEGFVQACEDALNESGEARRRRLSEALSEVFRISWAASADTALRLIEQELRKLPNTDAMLRELTGLASTTAPQGAALNAPSAARTQRRLDHIVVGAGISGLSAALHLQAASSPSRTLLVEREAEPGGACRSVHPDGFTFDRGGHALQGEDARTLALCEAAALGDNLRWQMQEAKLRSHGSWLDYPFDHGLHGLSAPVLQECVLGAIEARFGPLGDTRDATAAALPVVAHEEEIGLADDASRLWGAGIARHLVLPYWRKALGCGDETLQRLRTRPGGSAWPGGRYPAPDLRALIAGALAPQHGAHARARMGYPLSGGFQAIADALFAQLQCEIAMRTAVLHLSPREHSVRLDDGRIVRFETLVSTLALPVLIQACGDEAPAEIRAAAASLRHASQRCVNLGVQRLDGDTPAGLAGPLHCLHFPDADTLFHRVVLQGHSSPRCNAGGSLALTCEIGWSPQSPLPCEGAALVERVIAECRACGLIAADRHVLHASQIDVPYAFALRDEHTAARVQRIHAWLREQGIVAIGQFGEWRDMSAGEAFEAGRNVGPSSREYASRSPEGIAPGPWGGPADGRNFPLVRNDGPSSHEYLSRSPEGMAGGPWGGPADARKLSPRPPESASSDRSGERGS